MNGVVASWGGEVIHHIAGAVDGEGKMTFFGVHVQPCDGNPRDKVAGAIRREVAIPATVPVADGWKHFFQGSFHAMRRPSPASQKRGASGGGISRRKVSVLPLSA